MKITLYGDAEHEALAENGFALANEFHSLDLLPLLFTYMNRFDFEVSYLQKKLLSEPISLGTKRFGCSFQ
jgi:hypothetical protein